MKIRHFFSSVLLLGLVGFSQVGLAGDRGQFELYVHNDLPKTIKYYDMSYLGNNVIKDHEFYSHFEDDLGKFSNPGFGDIYIWKIQFHYEGHRYASEYDCGLSLKDTNEISIFIQPDSTPSMIDVKIVMHPSHVVCKASIDRIS